MTRLQYGVLGAAVGLFCLLYFVFGTQPPVQKTLETSRALTAEQTGIDVLQAEARAAIGPQQQQRIAALEEELANATLDSTRQRLQRELSGSWYAAGQAAVAGYYAQELAEAVNTAESWSIAGTTYDLCIQQSTQEATRDFCTRRGIAALENAISLAPDNVDHQVNLAMLYTHNPPADAPMKGVLQLRDLVDKYPSSTVVLNALARLAIRTGQYQRAVERLQQAEVLQPDNRTTLCLLATAYEGLGDGARAAAYAERCNVQK